MSAPRERTRRMPIWIFVAVWFGLSEWAISRDPDPGAAFLAVTVACGWMLIWYSSVFDWVDRIGRPWVRS